MNTTDDNDFFPSSSSAPVRISDKRWGVRSSDLVAESTFISEQEAICHSDSEFVLNLKCAQKRTEWGSVYEILCEQQ